MRRMWGMCRVLGLALLALGLLAGAGLHRAEAKLSESLRGFAGELAKLQGLSAHSEPHTLSVNGVELKIVTATTKLDVKTALDRIQGLCRTVPQSNLPVALRRNLESFDKLDVPAPIGVIREQSDADGILACIDAGQWIDNESFLARLAQFSRTGDLKTIGQLRYTMARRHAGVTTLLFLWTEGSMVFSELFPKAGDAPGRDPVGLPRPAGSRRVLSAFQEGMPYGVALYQVEGSTLDGATAAYKGQLERDSWAVQIDRGNVLVARKEGSVMTVRIDEKHPGRVVLSISVLG